MKYQFKSLFAEDINHYINLRYQLGNEEDTFARRLHSFDRFCVENYPTKKTVTQEIAESWCSLKSNEKEKTLQLRTNILRGFLKYLVSIGKNAYVIPEGFVGRGEPFVPYLYTDTELQRFFEAADKLPPHPLSPYREHVIPVIFRVLYCCGLRPQEVRYLKTRDVDLTAGTLYIEDSKQNKDRIVAMSLELLELCQRYNTLMETKLPDRDYFFQNPNGGMYRCAWVQTQFFKVWKATGISFSAKQRPMPRVYDWRHNFATRVIRRWMHQEKDVMNFLPYLSTYMGHESLQYTTYYIHLVPEHLKSPELTSWNCCQEVPYYED